MAFQGRICGRFLEGVARYLFLKLLVLILVIKAGNCVAEIISEPQNVTAYIGETVHFDCIYSGTDVPSWYIGGRGYSIDGLPRRHSYRHQILTVSNVKMTDSGCTYQCSFSEPVSKIATLTVLIREGSNITTTTTTTTSSNGTTSHLTESASTAAATRLTAALPTTAATDEIRIVSIPTENFPTLSPDGSTRATDGTLVIACASAIAVVVVVCLLFLIILSVVLRRKYVIIATKAKRPVTEQPSVVVPVINTVVNDHEEIGKSCRPYIIIPVG